MKKYINKVIILIAILFIAIYASSCINFVNANSRDNFSKLSMTIIVDEDGNAKVTEEWNISIYSGTELYKAFYNMQNSKIQNFKVSELGENYRTLYSWDVDASQSEKKNKCGINYVSEGYELCFGIGDYGTHTYTLEYEITNFVNRNDNSDFYLVDSMDPAPKSVNIVIKSNNSVFEDGVDVSFSGVEGNTRFENGMIVYTSTENMSNTDYLRCSLTAKNEKSVSSTSGQLISEKIDEVVNAEKKEETAGSKLWNVICVILIFFVCALVGKRYKKNKDELKEKQEENSENKDNQNE